HDSPSGKHHSYEKPPSGKHHSYENHGKHSSERQVGLITTNSETNEDNHAGKSCSENSKPSMTIDDLANLIKELHSNQAIGLSVSNNGASSSLKGMSSKIIFSNDEWIIDSGATDHMAMSHNGIHSFMNSYRSSNVAAANGSPIAVKGSGKVNFFNSPQESHVLVLPTLSYNLLSIAKLTKELDCFAVFSATNVVFQDRPARGRLVKANSLMAYTGSLNPDVLNASTFLTILKFGINEWDTHPLKL
ncbi:hypothetical protein QML37_30345, partial [Klebsiella pneumoniae]|uniref:hypothetical protein n=1 Tax=Klebsiella pneumoniae TaxID=573 RepID=UPI003A80A491